MQAYDWYGYYGHKQRQQYRYKQVNRIVDVVMIPKYCGN